MNELVIEQRAFAQGEEVHALIRDALDFPDYYGANFAALSDCLSEVFEPTRIVIVRDEGQEGEYAQWFDKLVTVLQRCAEDNPDLEVELASSSPQDNGQETDEQPQHEEGEMYGLKTESCFDSAHFLSEYDGKCENLHGHRWRVVAYIEVDKLQESGEKKDMVIDFADFKKAVRALTEELDHMFIVEEGSLSQETLDCLEKETFRLFMVPFRTTSENFARYFAERLMDQGFPVSQIEVYETPMNCAIYRPERNDPPQRLI